MHETRVGHRAGGSFFSGELLGQIGPLLLGDPLVIVTLIIGMSASSSVCLGGIQDVG
jgi:hypothetical protein